MIAAIYSRKSLFTAKGESIQNQINMCKDYGEKTQIHDFLIYKDEGFSGGSTNRPAFKKLICDAKAKKFDVLICYRLDRISRNVADFSYTLELLQKNNIGFISIKEQFDTTSPIGKAMVYIASVFAQLERETISERIKDNMLSLSKTGRWLGGQTPLGFKSEKILYLDENYQEKYMYKLSPIFSELNLVKLVFEKYLEFKSLRKVTAYLLENNFKTKHNCNFNMRCVSDLLTSPTYVKSNEKIFDYLSNLNINCIGTPDNIHGILTYNKKNNKNQFNPTSVWIAAVAKHNGIIDYNKWLQVQKILDSNKLSSPRLGKTHNALLTGILKCEICNSPMTIIHGSKNKFGHKFYYYSCSMKINSKSQKCQNRNLRCDKVDEKILSVLSNTFEIDLKCLNKNLSSSTKSKNTLELSLLNDTVNNAKTSIENLVYQLSQNKNSTAGKYIIKEIEKEEALIKETNLKISKYKDTHSFVTNNYDIDAICNTFKNSNIFLNSLESKYKKLFMKNFVKKITWNSFDEKIHVFLK